MTCRLHSFIYGGVKRADMGVWGERRSLYCYAGRRAGKRDFYEGGHRETGIKMNTCPVETVWDNGLKELAKEAAGHGVRVAVIEPGKELMEGQLHIACIQPGEDYMGEKGNAASVVLAVTCGEFDMLFTGDVEGGGEEVLTDILKERYADRSWEVLKVAHHGSKYSSAEDFLEAVKPEYAMISSGKENRYGHPHEETVERLEAARSKIYSTQECGAVGIEVKGNGMRIWPYLYGTDVNYAEENCSSSDIEGMHRK